MTAKQFFIGRAGKDKEWAQWIAWVIEENGYSAFLQDWDFTAASAITVKMNEGAACERTIAILSPDYLNSEYTTAEWASRYFEDPVSKQNKLVTIRVAKCDLPPLLKPISYIDLIGLDEANAEKRLLDGIQGIMTGRMKPA